MSVLILAEHDGERLKPAIHQIVTAAKTWGEPLHLLLVGEGLSALAQAAALVPAVEQVICVDAPHLKHLLAEDVAPLLAMLRWPATALATAAVLWYMPGRPEGLVVGVLVALVGFTAAALQSADELTRPTPDETDS